MQKYNFRTEDKEREITIGQVVEICNFFVQAIELFAAAELDVIANERTFFSRAFLFQLLVLIAQQAFVLITPDTVQETVQWRCLVAADGHSVGVEQKVV